MASPYAYGAISSQRAISAASLLNKEQKYEEASTRLDSVRDSFRFSFQQENYISLMEEVAKNRQLQAIVDNTQTLIGEKKFKEVSAVPPRPKITPTPIPYVTPSGVTPEPQLPSSIKKIDYTLRTADAVIVHAEEKSQSETAESRTYVEKLRNMSESLKKGHAAVQAGIDTLYQDSITTAAKAKFAQSENFYDAALDALSGSVPVQFAALNTDVQQGILKYKQSAGALWDGMMGIGFDFDALDRAADYLADAGYYFDLAATQ